MVARSRGGSFRSGPAASGLTALALGLLLSGCGSLAGDTDVTQGRPTATENATSSPSTAESPTVTETPTSAESPTSAEESGSASAQPSPGGPSSEPAATATTQDAAPAGRMTLKDRLLTDTEVPGFNEQYTWRVDSTKMHEGRQPFGTCHKFAMTSIGATKVAVRRYSPASDDPSSSASNLVAQFPDAMTAKRAFGVLKSWRGQCDEELQGYDRRDIGRLQAVETTRGIGKWYLLTYEPAEAESEGAYFDAQGLVRKGKTISVLQMRLVGQDYNYPAGEEPMVGAVRTSAEKLA